jgi:carbon storage regulator
MLVLSRQKDETIIIGDDIEITVVDIRGDKVRLGVSAPKSISVHRKEVYDAIRRENREAAQVKPEDLSGFGKPKPGATSPGSVPPGNPNPPPQQQPPPHGGSPKGPPEKK